MHVKRKEPFYGRVIGMVQERRPAKFSSRHRNRGFMVCKTLAIRLSQGFGAFSDKSGSAFLIEKLHPAVVRQALFGGIEDLKQVPSHILPRKPVEGGG